MAQFDASVTAAPQVQSAVTVKAGVVDNSASTIGQGVAGALNSLTGLLQQNNQTKNEMLLSKFQASQTAVLDAIDQRAIDPLFGRSQLRNNLSQMILAHPGLRDDLTKLQGSILGTAGMGSQAFDETDSEKRMAAQIDRAVTSGLVAPDASEADLLDAASAQQQLDLAASQYTTAMNELNLKAKTLDVNSKEYSANKEQRSDTSLTFLKAQVKPLVSQMQENVRQLVHRTDLSEAEKIQALDAYWAEVMVETSSARADVTTAQADALFSVLENTLNQGKEVINGTLDLSSLETQNKAVLAGSLNTLLKDPLFAQYVTLVKAAPGITTVLDGVVGTNLENTLSRMLLEGHKGEDGVNVFSGDSAKTYLDTLTKFSEKDTPETQEEVATQLEGLFSGVVTASGFLQKDAKKGIALVNWMATPEFLEMRLEHSSSITDVAAAQDIIVTHYSGEVWAMIRDQFEKGIVLNPETYQEQRQRLTELSRNKSAAMVPGGGTDLSQGSTPVPEAISYSWQNGSLRFIAIDGANQIAKEKARSLNKELAPIINTTVRGMAHLEGNTNYQGVFESIEGSLFGDQALAANSDDDSLDLDMFSEDQVGKSSKLLNLIDAKEGGGDYDTLLSFSNRSGRLFDGFSVSEMTLDEVVNFSKAGGEYAEFSKSEVGRMATPMGRYQIVGTTLKQTMKEMGLSGGTVFNAQTQDAMFRHIARKTLRGKTTPESRRRAMRGTWEGFKHVSDAELDAAIEEFL